jgi:SAM-dependent methyltransferase
MPSSTGRFALLSFPLAPLRSVVSRVVPKSKLDEHLGKSAYSVRLLRYWWAAQALAAEAKRKGRPLHVVDLGCERGWLKQFTPEGAVAQWTGLDWNPRREATEIAGYDTVLPANFDEKLPLPDGMADAVVSSHVFEHLPRPGYTMAEVSRLLRPGGIFLGCAPTLPHPAASLRERWFRRELAAGRIVPGGHITCLSPTRWRRLCYEVGLETEFATGSHAFRRTGSPLENHAWWIRLNQFWAALFPSLGSECCVQARRAEPLVSTPQSLPKGHGRHRGLWIAAVLATLAALAFAIRFLLTR